MKYTTINLDRINWLDERFRIGPPGSDPRLEDSIKTTGLVNPPVLVTREGSPVILSGWKRLSACKNLGFPLVQAFLFQEENDLEAFKLPVYENLTIRPFHTMEKAVIIEKLKNFGADSKSIHREFLPLLEIPSQPRFIDLYLKVAAFEPEMKSVLEGKDIAHGILEILSWLDSGERRALVPLLHIMGVNRRKEILTLLFEISRRDTISVVELLKSAEIQSIFHSESQSSSQKIDRLLITLQKLRNPLQFVWNESFESILKKLELNAGIAVIPPAFYEDDDYKLCFTFKDRSDFMEKITSLKRVGGTLDFSELFKLTSSCDE